MRALVALCVVIAAGCASAPAPEEKAAVPPQAAATAIPLHVLEDQGTSIRLMPGECAEPMIAMFVAQQAPQFLPGLREISSAWTMSDGSRREVAGCWFEVDAETGGGEEAFVLLFADGDRFVVPKARFLRGAGKGA